VLIATHFLCYFITCCLTEICSLHATIFSCPVVVVVVVVVVVINCFVVVVVLVVVGVVVVVVVLLVINCFLVVGVVVMLMVVMMVAVLSVGPFHRPKPNPTHQITDPTQSNSLPSELVDP